MGLTAAECKRRELLFSLLCPVSSSGLWHNRSKKRLARLLVEPRGVEPRSQDFQSCAYTKSAKVPKRSHGGGIRTHSSETSPASVPHHGSTMRPKPLESVCKVICLLCQFVGQPIKIFVFDVFFLNYPFMTAIGRSLVSTFTKSASLAMTVSMSL